MRPPVRQVIDLGTCRRPAWNGNGGIGMHCRRSQVDRECVLKWFKFFGRETKLARYAMEKVRAP